MSMTELGPIEPLRRVDAAPPPDPRLDANFNAHEAASAGDPGGTELVPTDTDAANNHMTEAAEPEVAPDAEEQANPQPEPAPTAKKEVPGKDHTERAVAEHEIAKPTGSMVAGATVEAAPAAEAPVGEDLKEPETQEVADLQDTDRQPPARIEDAQVEKRDTDHDVTDNAADRSAPEADEVEMKTSDAPVHEEDGQAPESAILEPVVDEHDSGPGEGERPGDDQEPDQGSRASERSAGQPHEAGDRRPAEPGSGSAGEGGNGDDLPPEAQEPAGEDDEAAFRALKAHFSARERSEIPPEDRPRHMSLYELSGVEHARFMINYTPDVTIDADSTIVDRQLIEHDLELAGLPNGWMRMVFTEPEQRGIEPVPQPWRAPGTRPEDVYFSGVAEFGMRTMMLIDYPRMLMPTDRGTLESTRGMVVAINRPSFTQVVNQRAETYRDRSQGRDRRAYDRAAADVLDRLARSALFQASMRDDTPHEPDPFPRAGLPRTFVNRARLFIQDRLDHHLIEYVPHPDD